MRSCYVIILVQYNSLKYDNIVIPPDRSKFLNFVLNYVNVMKIYVHVQIGKS